MLAFANRLRTNGIESVVDRYFEDTLNMRWTDWMDQEIEAAHFVLTAVTQAYAQHLKPGDSGSLGGTKFEGAIITQDLYDLRGRNDKFFAVYFDEADRAWIPKFLKGFAYYNVSTDDGYISLYRRLTKQPGVVPPEVGTIVDPNSLFARPPEPQVSSSGDQVAKLQIDTLARAYQELRKSMLPSNDRTRKMEIIAAKMRAVTCEAYFLLDYLAKNPAPGCRLAAASFLEVKPNVEYLDWLAERLAPEKPFVGYHAALALIAAVRVLGKRYHEDLKKAIEKALKLLGSGLEGTDRAAALKIALRELQEVESLEAQFLLGDSPAVQEAGQPRQAPS